jgi:TolB protein
MDIDGRSPRELTNGRQPDWSPDDRHIAFESATFPQQIFVVDVGTGQTRQITNTPGHSRAPSWSPDGEQIVFMTEVGSYWQLAVVDVATGVHEVITSGSPDKRFPVWSPDGILIAYNTLTATGGVDQIWTIEPDGDNARRLTTDGQNGRPTWSPDGRFLAFNANRNGSWLIYQMNRDGSNQRAVTDVADRQRPDWGVRWP